MDYFNINFILAFIGITVTIVTGNVKKSPRVFALGLPILVTEVSLQMLLVALGRSLHMRAPFHMSSVRKGEPVRSGVFVMAEDIIAEKGYEQRLLDFDQDSAKANKILFSNNKWSWFKKPKKEHHWSKTF